MAIYKLVENNNLIMSIPLSGCSEDLNRQELKDNLIETNLFDIISKLKIKKKKIIPIKKNTTSAIETLFFADHYNIIFFSFSVKKVVNFYYTMKKK